MAAQRMAFGVQRRFLKDFSVGILLAVTATSLRYLLTPTLGFRTPLLFHVLAVAVAAQVAGTVSALTVIALSVILIRYFFIPPAHTIGLPPAAGDLIAL